MQQGPVLSNEELIQKINALCDYIGHHPEELASRVTRNSNGSIDEAETLKSRSIYLKMCARQHGLKLNDKQAKLILTQAGTTAEKIIAAEDKPTNPNTTFTVQVILATATALLSTNIAGGALMMAGTRQTLHQLLDNRLGVYTCAVDVVLALLEYQYNLRSYGAAAATHMVTQFGALGYLSIPVAMIAYHNAPALLEKFNNSELVETMGDFTDIMGGFADDETYEKYRGSLAAMPFDEVPGYFARGVSSTLSWLWSKTPSLRSTSTTPVQEENQRAAASSCYSSSRISS